MLDNALPVFDMDAQRQLEPEKQVDAHLAALRADIDARKRAVQPASDWEKEFYAGYRHMIEEQGPYYVQPLYRVTGDCIGCGTCTRVCPMGCISLRDGRPEYQTDRCVGCMACIHACPQKAVQFASLHEVNPNARYRNPHIPLAELIRANRQP